MVGLHVICFCSVPVVCGGYIKFVTEKNAYSDSINISGAEGS